MAGARAHLRDEGDDGLGDEARGVGGREVVADEDGAAGELGDGALDAARAHERAEDALADELHVVAALAQVGVVHGGDAPRDVRAGGDDGPLRAALLAADLLLDGVVQDLVADHGGVGLQDGGLRGLVAEARGHLVEVLLHALHRAGEAIELAVRVFFVDVAAREGVLGRAHHDGGADRDAGSARDAAQHLCSARRRSVHHSGSPNFSAMRRPIACTASLA